MIEAQPSLKVSQHVQPKFKFYRNTLMLKFNVCLDIELPLIIIITCWLWHGISGNVTGPPTIDSSNSFIENIESNGGTVLNLGLSLVVSNNCVQSSASKLMS